ncbi:MAG: uncharacterized protein KVP18_002270 [Porospora cf. gigantea A]|uniref:uncharacterized protein n=1 Tax=Porospora cf. gigantea A TaxID=2853593 RepID=UPI003559B407|nr:MAG: hypothetical protein KVP18_002270 [Porospora cf. gigantea A]
MPPRMEKMDLHQAALDHQQKEQQTFTPSYGGGYGDSRGGYGERSGGYGERSGGYGDSRGGYGERRGNFGGRDHDGGERTWTRNQAPAQSTRSGYGDRREGGGFQARDSGFDRRYGGDRMGDRMGDRPRFGDRMGGDRMGGDRMGGDRMGGDRMGGRSELTFSRAGPPRGAGERTFGGGFGNRAERTTDVITQGGRSMFRARPAPECRTPVTTTPPPETADDVADRMLKAVHIGVSKTLSQNVVDSMGKDLVNEAALFRQNAPLLDHIRAAADHRDATTLNSLLCDNETIMKCNGIVCHMLASSLAKEALKQNDRKGVQLAVKTFKPVYGAFQALCSKALDLRFLVEMQRVICHANAPCLEPSWWLLETIWDALYSERYMEDAVFHAYYNNHLSMAYRELYTAYAVDRKTAMNQVGTVVFTPWPKRRQRLT